MLEIDAVSEQENKKSDVFILSVLRYMIGSVSNADHKSEKKLIVNLGDNHLGLK